MIIYDIAISFAGEDRDVAKKIVQCLKQKGLSVFYDFDFQYDLVGKDLYQHLYKIYKDSALFFVPIISKNYIKKPWAMHELKAAQEREFDSNCEYILPIKLDDTPIPSISITRGNLDLNQLSVAKISTIIKKKIDKAKNNIIYEQEQLYNNLMHSFDFLINRFCILSQLSKEAEFTHLPLIIEKYKETVEHLKHRLNKDFNEIIHQLLDNMKVEEDEHINGSDEKSLWVKQINLRRVYIRFKQAYLGFAACKYNDKFDFWYYIDYQEISSNNDEENLTKESLEEIIELIKHEVKNPMSATELYRESLKIALLDNFSIIENIDIDKLLSLFPEELINEFEKSPRINQEAFDSLKNKNYDK